MVFLGIDGGGSKTSFLLEDEAGQEIDRDESGPSNWLSAGEREAFINISEGIAGLTRQPDIICGGFAGAGRLEGVRFYFDCLTRILPEAQIFVETDAFIAYVGAIGLEPGVLLIAGTGSIAIGRRQDGSMIRTGGWGPDFGDEGSGFWIGREAIRTALRCNDAGDSPQFVASVCEALRLNSINDVVTAWKSGALPVRTVASLTALLFRQHPAEPANRILKEAAEQLRAVAEAAIAKVGIPECRRSIAGSIGSAPLMQSLLRAQSGLEFQPPIHSPAKGAIIWARSQVRH